MSLAEFDEIDFTHSAVRLDQPSPYLLKKARRKGQDGLQELRDSFKSSTVYVGNLSFYTTEEQLYEVFSKVGKIKQIIMGLDRFRFTPCGFCFIIYQDKDDSINAVKYLNGTKLDDRALTIDLDPGFKEGRQFGRGVYGGQVSDEARFEYDNARGGYGRHYQQQIEGANEPELAVHTVDGANFNNARFGARRVQTDTYIPGRSNDDQDGNEEEESAQAGKENDQGNDRDGDFQIEDAGNEKNEIRNDENNENVQ